MAEYPQSEEGGSDKAIGQEDMQSYDKLSTRPSEEDCDSTEPGMCFFKSAAVLCFYVHVYN